MSEQQQGGGELPQDIWLLIDRYADAREEFMRGNAAHLARQLCENVEAAKAEVVAAIAQRAASVPAGWRIVEKKTHFALCNGNRLVASLTGPEAEQNAAIIAHAIDAASVPVQAKTLAEKLAEWKNLERISNIPGVHEALKDFSEDATGDNGCYVIQEILKAAAPAQPEAPNPQDAVDAARYRFLCEFNEWGDDISAAFDCSGKSVIDKAIDAARTRNGGKNE